MNLLILVPSFKKSSPIDGAFQFAKFLYEKGENVVFVSLDKKTPTLVGGLASSGVNFFSVESDGWLGIISAKKRLQRYINEQAIDVVIVYEIRPTLVCLFLKDIVKVVSVRGMLREAYNLYYNYCPFIINVFVWLQVVAIKNMDCVISMNKDMTKWLESEGVNPENISLVNNFVDVDAINNVMSPAIAQRNDKICNIGVFCNFVPAKRISDIIKSVYKVITDHENNSIHLHLAGNGPLYGEMKRLVSEFKIDAFCSFHGFLEEPLPLMAKMDIVILASVTEGIPRCLMEALSLGKTVISSEIAGVRDLVIDKQTGYLFKLGDVNGLAKLIDFIVRNNSYLPSSDLVEFMRKNFDVKICGCLFLAEIKNAFKQKKYVQHALGVH